MHDWTRGGPTSAHRGEQPDLNWRNPEVVRAMLDVLRFPDHELMNDVNTTMAMLGRGQLAGVVIDANRTTVYTENPADGTTSFPRCGY